MNKIEAIIDLQLPPGASGLTEQLQQCLKSLDGVEQLMLVTNEGSYEPAHLTFNYADDAPVLDRALEIIQAQGSSVVALQVHLPSTLSGIADAYDARDKADAVLERLTTVQGILDTAIGNNGVIHVQLSKKNQSQDAVVSGAIARLQSN